MKRTPFFLKTGIIAAILAVGTPTIAHAIGASHSPNPCEAALSLRARAEALLLQASEDPDAELFRFTVVLRALESLKLREHETIWFDRPEDKFAGIKPEALRPALVQLLRNLTAKGFFIFYNADSRYADIFASPRSVGIAGSSEAVTRLAPAPVIWGGGSFINEVRHLCRQVFWNAQRLTSTGAPLLPTLEGISDAKLLGEVSPRFIREQLIKYDLAKREHESPDEIMRDIFAFDQIQNALASRSNPRAFSIDLRRKAMTESVIELTARNLREDGTIILYNADAPYAKKIAEGGGELAFGITQSPYHPDLWPAGRVFLIRHPLLFNAALTLPSLGVSEGITGDPKVEAIRGLFFNYRLQPNGDLLPKFSSGPYFYSGGFSASDIQHRSLRRMEELDPHAFLAALQAPPPAVGTPAEHELRSLALNFGATYAEKGGKPWMDKYNAQAEDRYQKERAAAEARRAEENRLAEERRINREVEADALRAQVVALIGDASVKGAAVRDLFTYLWVDLLPFYRTVGVGFGNSEGGDAENIAVVKELVKKNNSVIYDADSALAPTIRQVAGHLGIGVSGHADPSEGQPGLWLKVENPYIRLRIFKRIPLFFTAPDSLTGLALALRDSPTFMFDRHDQWRGRELMQWAADLHSSGGALGIRTAHRAIKVKDLQEFRKQLANHRDSEPVKLDWADFLKNIPGDLVKDLLDQSENYAEGVAALDASPAEAVVFGSGKDGAFTELTRRAAKVLGELKYGTATGGAGGQMQAANEGATQAGVTSIGIPMMSKYRVKGEQQISSNLHTLTFAAAGYEVRIPLLLHNRKLVVIAPGGDGTMREIATVIVELASHLDVHARIVFLSTPYYEGFVKQILALPIPEDLKARIYLVDDPEHQLPAIVKEIP